MPQIPFDTNMWFLLTVVTLVVLLMWTIRAVRTGTLTVAWNGTAKQLGLLVLAAFASLLISPNKIEAILTPFGQGTFLSLFLLPAVGSTCLDDKARTILRWIIMGAVSATGLLLIYQFAGFPRFIEVNATLVPLFVVSLPFLSGEVIHRKRAGHDHHMIIAIVMGIACMGGLILTAYQTLPTWSQTTLPYWANWQILLESYKNWQRLLVGVGAENFLSAFTAGRPASLNMTPLWNTRFTLGSSLMFHIATVYGLLGTAAFGWFLTKVHPVAILAFLLLPPSFPALIVVATILISHESVRPVTLTRHSFARFIAVVVFFAVAAAGYGLIRSYGAELAFARSLNALANRDGTLAYNLQVTAITTSPRIARFHLAYSQTNLALANALSATATPSAAPEQRDQDRQTATQLVQQAIREAKIGVNLAPQNILAWENLAGVYQALTGAAKGADQWTVAAYQQAVTLDPSNPVIRLRLGGAYVGQQKLDQATDSYLTAAALKPDYANAYYNLAFSYREQKKYLLASKALKNTLPYVTPGTDDGIRAQQELDALRELLTEEEKRTLDEGAAPAVRSQTSPEPLSPLAE